MSPPLSLGIETLGGVFTRLIERNTTIPTKKSQVFSTAEDNQSAVTISVWQGEREMAKDNKHLGQFNLDGIPPAPRGMPQIEVSFDIDANGIVNVTATDKATGKAHNIRIEASGGLSDDDIEKMVKQAEENAAQDKEKRDMAEARNQAESLIHASKKTLEEHKDKIDEADKSACLSAIDELETLLKDDKSDKAQLEEKTKALTQASMKIGEAIYKAQAEKAEQDKATGNKDNERSKGGEGGERGESSEQARAAQAQGNGTDRKKAGGASARADDVVEGQFEKTDTDKDKAETENKADDK